MASAGATISIMEEFLRSSEPQARKNVLTALSVVDDEAGAALMAEAALSDEDPGVRKKALEEIVALSERTRPFTVKLFAEALGAEDEERQQRAYFLLGQLRNKGVDIHDVRVPQGKGMRLAASLVSRTFLARNWLYRLRGWRYGFWSTLAGSFLFLIYALQAFMPRVGGADLSLVLGVTLAELGLVGLGTLLAIFATQFSAPISLQLSRLHALFVELITSLIGSVVGMLLLYTILGGLLNKFNWDVGSIFLLLIIPVCGLLAVAVRLGTVIGFSYRRFARHPRGRRLSRTFEIACGTLVGFAAVSVVYFFYLLDNIGDARGFDFKVFTAMWLASGAVAAGLASAFAKIDSEGPPE